MQPIPESDIKTIRDMRRKGESIKVIAKTVGRSPATVKKYTDDITMSDDSQAALNRRGADAINSLLTNEQRSKRNRKAAHTRLATEGGRRTWNKIRVLGAAAAGLAYREDEKPVLRVLEARYDTTFKKEEMDGLFFDFTNDQMVIEHTVDHTHGIQSAIARFALLNAKKDGRRRILITRTGRGKLGAVRLSRLDALGVEVIDVFEFQ